MTRESWGKCLIFLLKTVVAIAVILILTIPGCLLDLTYQEQISYAPFLKILNHIKAFLSAFGATHKELLAFITGNIGIIITFVSVFFTFTIEMYERSEKKIFGISRKKIMDKKSKRQIKYIYWIVALLPFFVIIYNILGFCAGSYLLLFWSYIFLLCLYNLYRGSYDDETMKVKLCTKMMETFWEKGSVKEVETWVEYQNFLTDIYEFITKEGDWSSAQELFFEFLERLRKVVDDICYVGAYYFVNIAFGQRNLNHKVNFFRVIEYYMGNIEYNEEGIDYVDKKDKIFLWGMLTASMSYANERELIKFLKSFSNFKERSISRIRCHRTELFEQVCRKECAMVLVLLEKWLDDYDSEERELALLAKPIYIKGINMFDRSNITGMSEIMILCEELPDSSWNIHNIIDRFEEEYHSEIKISNVANLIECL